MLFSVDGVREVCAHLPCFIFRAGQNRQYIYNYIVIIYIIYIIIILYSHYYIITPFMPEYLVISCHKYSIYINIYIRHLCPDIW